MGDSKEMSSFGASLFNLKNRDFDRTKEGVWVKNRELCLISGCVKMENGLLDLTLVEDGSSMVSFSRIAIWSKVRHLW